MIKRQSKDSSIHYQLEIVERDTPTDRVISDGELIGADESENAHDHFPLKFLIIWAKTHFPLSSDFRDLGYKLPQEEKKIHLVGVCSLSW